MIESRDELYLWVEKYRPQTIDECVLPDALKDTFKQYIAKGDLPNFMFAGTAGVGKTTVAKALCNEIGAEYIIINGSDEGRRIETLRTVIRDFASTVSLTDSKKVVIIDEADYMNAESVQPAMRAFIEDFSSNCRFIFTCNYKNKIIEPLHSRCSVIEFKIDSKDKQQIAGTFFKRACQILTQEEIKYDPKVVAEVISKYFPDYRRVLNELQRYSAAGEIDSGILVNVSEESYKALVKTLKEKDFGGMRKWVAKNADSDPVSLFQNLYTNCSAYMEPASIPQLVLVLANYQYKSAFVANQEINIVAAMTEIMVDCKFL
jgi:DNA polymerase III delta prime subunit